MKPCILCHDGEDVGAKIENGVCLDCRRNISEIFRSVGRQMIEDENKLRAEMAEEERIRQEAIYSTTPKKEIRRMMRDGPGMSIGWFTPYWWRGTFRQWRWLALEAVVFYFVVKWAIR